MGLRNGVMAPSRVLLAGLARRPVQRPRLPDVGQHGGRRLGEDELDGGVAATCCRRPVGAAAGAFELAAGAVGHPVEGGGGHGALVSGLSPSDVADVAGPERRDGRGGGGRRLRDGHAAEDRLDGGLAELPVPGPEQADGAVDRVEHAAAGLVQQRPEQGCIQPRVHATSVVNSTIPQCIHNELFLLFAVLHTMNMMRPAKTQTFSGITRALQFDIKKMLI